MAARTVKVGVRNTEFCRRQTEVVLDRLKLHHDEDVEFEVTELPAAAILDGLGAGAYDLHVCGVREVPIDLPDDVALTAVSERVDPFDVLVSRDGAILEDLPEGAVLAVESLRVKVQLEAFREDMKIELKDEPLDQLYAQLNAGDLSAFIVAAEDVATMGWQESVSEVFPPDILLPSAGQGSFAFLTRPDDAATADLVNPLDHVISRQVAIAERAFLQELAVRPTDPVAVHGSFEGDTLVLEALLGDEVSGAILRDDLDGEPEEESALGVRLAKLFIADGARDYLASYK